MSLVHVISVEQRSPLQQQSAPFKQHPLKWEITGILRRTSFPFLIYCHSVSSLAVCPCLWAWIHHSGPVILSNTVIRLLQKNSALFDPLPPHFPLAIRQTAGLLVDEYLVPGLSWIQKRIALSWTYSQNSKRCKNNKKPRGLGSDVKTLVGFKDLKLHNKITSAFVDPSNTKQRKAVKKYERARAMPLPGEFPEACHLRITQVMASVNQL